jgi:hypothetical protein
MTYVEPEWKWYVAELVLQTRLDGDPRIVGKIEIVLLYADSPKEAYRKAQELVDDSEFVYRNNDGVPVRERYLGIHELDNLQVTKLEDGTVLAVRLLTNTSSEELHGLVREKHELSLFGSPP